MISKHDLKKIAFIKFDSAKLLFTYNKYDTSLYVIGYVIELALKYKICKILKFDSGFPETQHEFDVYLSDKQNYLSREIKSLREIRNHDLKKLLYYSGKELLINAQLYNEWLHILYWSPKVRYKLNIGNKKFNEMTLKAVQKIVTLIFKQV